MLLKTVERLIFESPALNNQLTCFLLNFVTLSIYNIPLFLFRTLKLAAYQDAFRSLSGNGGDIVSQQFCKYGLNSASNTENDSVTVSSSDVSELLEDPGPSSSSSITSSSLSVSTSGVFFSGIWLFLFWNFFLLPLSRHTQSETSHQTFQCCHTG